MCSGFVNCLKYVSRVSALALLVFAGIIPVPAQKKSKPKLAPKETAKAPTELEKLRDDTSLPRRAGWMLDGKRVPREGYAVLAGNKPVGVVTSGTFSPTLGRPIAMGYVPGELAQPGSELTIDIRGHQEPARAVPLPFYRRTS